jgi:hypothetical protein
MDLPASDPSVALVIVMSAFALVTAAAVLLQRLAARRNAAGRAGVPDASASENRPVEPAADLAVVPARPRPSATVSSAGAHSADDIRTIFDPALPPASQAYPWRPATCTLPFDVLGYDGSRVWGKEESDGLVALFHLGTDMDALADEVGVDVRALFAELARRVYGAVDPVVDPSRPHNGAEWTAEESARALAVADRAVCLDDTARQLGRDQLDVVTHLIRNDVRTLRPVPVR